MGYTLGEAAKATGKHKTTISKAIKKGDISATMENGQYDIDPAELHRVYPPVSKDDDGQQSNGLPPSTEVQHQIKELQIELAAEKRHNATLQSQLDETRTDRDRWRQQATALLEGPKKREQVGFVTRGWRWLFGIGEQANQSEPQKAASS